MSREVMQLALDALEKSNAAYRGYGEYISQIDVDATAEAIAALKAELAKPEPEPVAWMRPSEEGYDSAFRDNSTVVECTGNKWEGWFPLYRKEDVK